MDLLWILSGNGLCFGLIFGLVACCVPVSCIQVNAPEEVNAVRGENVTLSCYFTSTSRPTSLISVDWSYRPPSGGPPQIFFHFSSVPYLPEAGQLKGRVQWRGNPARSEATIQLLNTTLNDNGTYICAVRNPPDVHGPPADTVLTVFPKKTGSRFSDVAVLLGVIIFPSVLIAMALLVRVLCPCWNTPTQNCHPDHLSPIEVTDGEEFKYKHDSSTHKSHVCCEIYDLDEEDYCSYTKEPLQTEAESKC